MLKIKQNIIIHSSEIRLSHMRSPGPGGQHVNKVATAVLLRFNIEQSSLPDYVKEKLKKIAIKSISLRGDLIIKASRFRSQDRNRADALERLRHLVTRASATPKKRIKTKLPFSAKQNRLSEKKKHGQVKLLRNKSTINARE